MRQKLGITNTTFEMLREKFKRIFDEGKPQNCQLTVKIINPWERPAGRPFLAAGFATTANKAIMPQASACYYLLPLIAGTRENNVSHCDLLRQLDITIPYPIDSIPYSK